MGHGLFSRRWGQGLPGEVKFVVIRYAKVFIGADLDELMLLQFTLVAPEAGGRESEFFSGFLRKNKFPATGALHCHAQIEITSSDAQVLKSIGEQEAVPRLDEPLFLVVDIGG